MWYDVLWFSRLRSDVDYELVISKWLFNWLWTRSNNWLQTIKSMQSNNNLIALRFAQMVIYFIKHVFLCGVSQSQSRLLIQLHQIQILSLSLPQLYLFHFVSHSPAYITCNVNVLNHRIFISFDTLNLTRKINEEKKQCGQAENEVVAWCWIFTYSLGYFHRIWSNAYDRNFRKMCIWGVKRTHTLLQHTQSSLKSYQMIVTDFPFMRTHTKALFFCWNDRSAHFLLHQLIALMVFIRRKKERHSSFWNKLGKMEENKLNIII